MDKILMVGYGLVGKMCSIAKGYSINNEEINEVIKFSTNEYSSRFIGAYMMENGSKILETVQIFDKDKVSVDNLFKTVAYFEESIYETSIVNKVKIGKVYRPINEDCISDLLNSIKQPYTGFTLEVERSEVDSDWNIYLLVCMGGEYHKNPYFKDKCIH